MNHYRHIGVASAFSPTFAAVLAEARRFAADQGATLEVLHAAEYDAEKEARFHAEVGPETPIRWITGETPALAIAVAAAEAGYDLVIAGALRSEDADRPYTSGVARDLLRAVGCDLMLISAPQMEPVPLSHIVFACDPGTDCEDLVVRTARFLGAQQVTVAITDTPFAAALAVSRGETPCDVQAWSAKLGESLRTSGLVAETWVVTSNTGYAFCDAVQGLGANILVVEGNDDPDRPLPVHLDWLYQVIPLRLLVVRNS